MLVNHKIQIFLDFLEVYLKDAIFSSSIRWWRYGGRIFNAVSAREGDLKVPKPERPPSRSHPVGHGKSVTSSMCNTVDFCLYAAVLRMERCADLVSVFFGTYSGTLCRSVPCILRYLW